MSSKYNYKTGVVTLDFHLKRVDSTCVREDGQRCLVGVRCHQCDHYKGMRNNFVLCGYHTEDDEGAQPTRCLLANEVRESAMVALDYL